MPKPKAGETKSEFLNRCIPIVINEGKPQAQAVAICNSYWESREKAIKDFLKEIKKSS